MVVTMPFQVKFDESSRLYDDITQPVQRHFVFLFTGWNSLVLGNSRMVT